jgi:hypothetical protein
MQGSVLVPKLIEVVSELILSLSKAKQVQLIEGKPVDS